MNEVRKLNRIKAVLAEQGVSGKDLANALGVSPITVSRWAQNSSQPDLYMLDKIARYLNVDVSELLNNTNKLKL